MWWLRFLALPPPPFVVGDVCLADPGGLAAKPAFGPKPRLNDQQLVALEALLEQGAVAHGWPNHLWTSKRVAVMIQRHFRIHYHPAHVYRLLVQRLNWTSRTPLKLARERNIKEVERRTSDDWPRIIRQAYQRHARLALLDETPVLDYLDRHDRLSVIALSPRAQRVGLHFMLLDDNKNFHGEEVVLFLRQLKGEVGAVDNRVGTQHDPQHIEGSEAMAGEAP